MAIQTGITILDMSGTSEVAAITISAASQGTLVHKLRVDLTSATVGATAKLYEGGVANVRYEKALAAGEMADISDAIAVLEETVLTLTPEGGGGEEVPISVKAVTEDIGNGDLDRYVSSTGNDDNDGTISRPWLTFNYAFNNTPNYGVLHVSGAINLTDDIAPSGRYIEIKGEAIATINFGNYNFSQESGVTIFKDIKLTATGEMFYYTYGVKFVNCEFNFSGSGHSHFYYGRLDGCTVSGSIMPIVSENSVFVSELTTLIEGPVDVPARIRNCLFVENVLLDMAGIGVDFIGCVFLKNLTITNGNGHLLIDCRVIGTKDISGITEINSEQWAKEDSFASAISVITATILSNLKRIMRKIAPGAVNEIKE